MKQRLQAIGEARIVLDATDELGQFVGLERPKPVAAISTHTCFSGGARAGLVALVAAGSGWWLARANIPSPVVSRLSVSLPVPLSTHYETANVALSPDGGTLAYVGVLNGTARLYVRNMDQIEVRPLAGTEGATGPVFSPDGAWIAFVADRKLKKVPVLGGSPTVVNEGNPDTLSIDWEPDGSIVFTPGFTLGLARVSASGGVAQTVMTPDPNKGESGYLWPRVMPGATDLLFVINPESNASLNEGRIAVEALGRKDSREILDAQGSFPLYAASGHLVFFSGGSVRAAPFDLRRRKMTGPAVPVIDAVSVAPHTGAVQAAISRHGNVGVCAYRRPNAQVQPRDRGREWSGATIDRCSAQPPGGNERVVGWAARRPTLGESQRRHPCLRHSTRLVDALHLRGRRRAKPSLDT